MSAIVSNPKPRTSCDRILVIGADHLLDGDDGIAAQIIERLRQVEWPEHVEIVHAGPGGFQVFELLGSAPHIVLIDAVSDGLWPGSVSRYRVAGPEDMPASLLERSIGLRELLAAAADLGDAVRIDVVTVSVDEIRAGADDLGCDFETAVAGVSRLVRELTR